MKILLLAILCLSYTCLAFRKFGRIRIASQRAVKFSSTSPAAETVTPLPQKKPKSAEFFAVPALDRFSKPNLLKEVNSHGLSLLPSFQLPYFKNEAWRNVKLTKLFQTRYLRTAQHSKAHIKEDSLLSYVDERCVHSRIVFVDGLFSAELSSVQAMDEGIKFGLLEDEKEEPVGEVAEGLKASLLDTPLPDAAELSRDSLGSDALSAFNLGMTDSVLYLDVKGKAPKPLQILYVNSLRASKEQLVSSFPRLVINVHNNSEVNIKQSYISLQEEGQGEGEELANFVGGCTQIRVGENATLCHSYGQLLNRRVRHTEVISAGVLGGGSYTLSVLQWGGEVSRVNVHVDLLMPKSNTTISAVMAAEREQSQDLRTSVQHLAEDCHTNQQQRIILGDGGEGTFKGRIRIPSVAQESSADQMCRSILLGDKVKLNVMPTLEISADRITCTHGAAVSDLDETLLFYLASRGINRVEARKLLLKSYPREVLGSYLTDENENARINGKVTEMSKADEERQLMLFKDSPRKIYQSMPSL